MQGFTAAGIVALRFVCECRRYIWKVLRCSDASLGPVYINFSSHVLSKSLYMEAFVLYLIVFRVAYKLQVL